jgi:hypothetical protein
VGVADRADTTFAMGGQVVLYQLLPELPTPVTIAPNGTRLGVGCKVH